MAGMDPRGFFRARDTRSPYFMESGLSILNGLQGLQGLNPLATVSGLGLDIPPDLRGRGKIIREEAALEAKVVQIIVSGDWESLKPNSGRSVGVSGHHICVAYHDEPNNGYRVWEWHGHILMFDEEDGYTPEYVCGNYFQPLQNVTQSSGNAVNGIGLSGAIASGNGKQDSVLHRHAQK